MRRRILLSLNDSGVDLGLPSGTIWAKGNIVPNEGGGYKIGEETDTGAYFSWGNVDPHFIDTSGVFENNYGFAYFNSNSPYAGSSGASIVFTSSTKGRDYPANATYDAAQACVGKSWQVPTMTQIEELINNTDSEWVANYNSTGIAGRKYMKKSDNSVYIFLPAKGYGAGQSATGSNGFYWSSSLCNNTDGYRLYFTSASAGAVGSRTTRSFGCLVRPVK